MKKLLAVVTGLVLFIGVGLAVFLGLFANRGGGEISGEVLAVGLYQDDTSGSWTCDDIREITNPPGVDALPPVVAIIEAEDIGFRIELRNRNLASAMIAGSKSGRPYTQEKDALKEIEDGVLLYIAIVRETSQSEPGLAVSEEEARSYLASHPPGTCESGGPVAIQGLTEDELVRGIQIQHTTTRFVQELINDAVPEGSIRGVDQTIADMIAQARPTVKITEVAFAPAGGLECTEGGAKVACPRDLPTPTATATPPATP